jgi:hypothetical protein
MLLRLPVWNFTLFLLQVDRNGIALLLSYLIMCFLTGTVEEPLLLPFAFWGSSFLFSGTAYMESRARLSFQSIHLLFSDILVSGHHRPC